MVNEQVEMVYVTKLQSYVNGSNKKHFHPPQK